MRKNIVLPVFTLVLTVCLVLSARADTLPNEAVQEIIARARAGFWGNAKLPDGSVVHPKSDDERNSAIIPDQDARKVVQAGIPAGLAMWCDVEWKEYYEQYMQRERRGTWTEKQIAFIGVLFGTSQGSVNKMMNDECDDDTRRKVVTTIESNIRVLKEDLENE